MEPTWIDRAIAEALHHEQLREHGGQHGIRDENMLESALARPQQKWAYAPECDTSDLAAAYAFGIAKNHPFLDGNKRTAFMVAYTFLGVNRLALRASQKEVVLAMLAVAAGEMPEADLARWIRSNIVAI